MTCFIESNTLFRFVIINSYSTSSRGTRQNCSLPKIINKNGLQALAEKQHREAEEFVSRFLRNSFQNNGPPTLKLDYGSVSWRDNQISLRSGTKKSAAGDGLECNYNPSLRKHTSQRFRGANETKIINKYNGGA